MKKTLNTILSLVLAAALVVTCAVSGFAAKSHFAQDAYASVITVSDVQDKVPDAFTRFGNILKLMKADGLTDPDSVLVGGDFSKILPDYATPGIQRLKDAYASVYPSENPASVICVQGNHDLASVGFTKTGLYDMGAYWLYAVNENDFPWNQYLRLPLRIRKLADKMSSELAALAESGDSRPVLVLTHVPLHHTDRTKYGDNMYSSYLFNVLNEAAEKLDIVFLFGHNHSGHYDDYIGGTVNFLAPGDTIRIPLPDKKGEDCYTEETLNFTYTNCGYVGYSNNGTENGSTDILTVGTIQIMKDRLRFIRYSEEGFVCEEEVERPAPSAASGELIEYPALKNEFMWNIMSAWFSFIFRLFSGLKTAV